MKIAKIIFLFILATTFGSASGQMNVKVSDSGSTDARAKVKETSARARAEDIIAKAREVAFKNIKADEIKGIKFSFESKLPAQGAFEEGVTNFELNVLFPDKILNYGISKTSQNTSYSTAVLDGNLYDLKTEVISGGKPSNVNLNFGTKESQMKELKWRTWSFVFPVTLDVWYYPLEFKYIGIAQSNDEKAETLEAVSPSNTIYRLFFDQNSHRLLMMTQKFQTKENAFVENKYFFSDYREENGLIIAHKIDVQQNSELVEERIIKSLKINPDFKPNFFDVKEK